MNPIPTVALLIYFQRAAGSKSGPLFLQVLRQRLRQTVMPAPFFASALVMANTRIPIALTHGLSVMGVSSAGLSAFATGIILQAQKPKLTWAVSVLALIRTAVIPDLSSQIWATARHSAAGGRSAGINGRNHEGDVCCDVPRQ